MPKPQTSLTHTPFYFLRHGETDWNRDRKWQGKQDIPLNEKGEAQARAVRAHVDSLGIKTICTSPLQRAKKTAELAAGHLDVPMHMFDDLQEVGFGPYEGTHPDDNSWYQGWKCGEHVDGVEGFDAFQTRSLHAINRALEQEGPVLIVAHGGVFWTVRDYAGLDRDMGVWNCALLRLTPPCPERPFWLHEALNPQD